MQRIQACVTGSGYFPLDMLRYDSCFPASESDAYLIERTFNKYGYWTINIAKMVSKPSKDWRNDWCIPRWASFNVHLAPSCFSSPSFEDIAERKAKLEKTGGKTWVVSPSEVVKPNPSDPSWSK